MAEEPADRHLPADSVSPAPTASADANWHRPLAHIVAGALSGSTAQTPGMTRLEAVSGRTVGSENLWMGETHVGPGTNSGDHHHGEAETAIYVVSGTPRFVFLEDGHERIIQTAPGDYVFVPPFTPHREENPSADQPAVVVIARTTQEGTVVNLPNLWPSDRA